MRWVFGVGKGFRDFRFMLIEFVMVLVIGREVF